MESHYQVEEENGKARLYRKKGWPSSGRKQLPFKGYSFETLLKIKHLLDADEEARLIREDISDLAFKCTVTKLVIGQVTLASACTEKEIKRVITPLVKKLQKFGISVWEN
jgi:hypothetical protein